MPKRPSCAPDDEPPRFHKDPDKPDDRDDSSYPIAIGLRRDSYSGQFRRKQPGDPLPSLFDSSN